MSLIFKTLIISLKPGGAKITVALDNNGCFKLA